jgi:hypothetical protein
VQKIIHSRPVDFIERTISILKSQPVFYKNSMPPIPLQRAFLIARHLSREDGEEEDEEKRIREYMFIE